MDMVGKKVEIILRGRNKIDENKDNLAKNWMSEIVERKRSGMRLYFHFLFFKVIANKCI